MPLTHLRDAIDKLLAALDDGAEISDGVTLKVRPDMAATLSRDADTESASLAFDPPPELLVRRGVLHLRCTLRAVVIGREEVRLAIDGWFDRRWQVAS